MESGETVSTQHNGDEAVELLTLAKSTITVASKWVALTQIEVPHLSKLKGRNYHEDEPPEAEVESISVGQTGVRLPL